VGIYGKKNMEEMLQSMARWVEKKEYGVKTLVGGDFNARTGMRGGRVSVDEDEDEEMERKSKDKVMNKEGRRLVNWIRERGWAILNGGIEGDEEGNWTYTRRRGKSIMCWRMRRVEMKWKD